MPEPVVLGPSVGHRVRAISTIITDWETASADRRPVDPPPVVGLRIFESEPGSDKQTDITFVYNANFFLYTTIQTARPTAQDCLPDPPSLPSLTGVPVAGITYLDRSTPAAYFIFLDLSVRHEGRFVLKFHLYEGIKDARDSTTPLPDTILRNDLSTPKSPQTFLHFCQDV